MGRKPNQDKETSPKTEPTNDPKTDEDEDTPIIKELKTIDDKYLEIERQFEKEVLALKKVYEEKYKPVVAERSAILLKGDEKTGTPGCKGFWVEALSNHPAFEDLIQEWDVPVLESLSDITSESIGDGDKNFKLSFHFADNDYFDNKVISLELSAEESNPYIGDVDVKTIKCDEIVWKTGKNVTVAKAQKKAKAGAKKSKAKGKETMEPRDSFFRRFLVTITKGEDLPEQISCLPEIAECGADEEEIIEGMMDEIYEAAMEVKDRVVPFAVRWYTGEAAPDDEDSDDEGSESEEEDESSEDEAPKGKNKKTQPKKKDGKGSPGGGPAAAPKEECKQQ